MSKIVFFCIPAHGHTNPTLNVVRELISRGHQVWYYSYEMLPTYIQASIKKQTAGGGLFLYAYLFLQNSS